MSEFEQRKSLEIEDYEDDEITQEEIQRMMARRKERYEDQKVEYEEGKNKKVSLATVIVLMSLLFIYYAVIFVLNAIGKISGLWMLGLSIPPVVIAVVAYEIYKKKNRRRD